MYQILQMMCPTIFPIQRQPNTAWTRRQVRGYSGTLGDSFKSHQFFHSILFQLLKLEKMIKDAMLI